MMILASGNGQDTEILSLSSLPVLPAVCACIPSHTLCLHVLTSHHNRCKSVTADIL